MAPLQVAGTPKPLEPSLCPPCTGVLRFSLKADQVDTHDPMVGIHGWGLLAGVMSLCIESTVGRLRPR